MSKRRKISLWLALGVIIALGASCVYYKYCVGSSWPPGISFGEYKPYTLGTEIQFKKGGNSRDFVYMRDGWGGQGRHFTYTMGKTSTIKLRIKDGANKGLNLEIMAFGLYDAIDKHQEIHVFVNDIKLKTLKVASSDSYTIQIPPAVMPTDDMVIRFEAQKPYLLPNETKKMRVGMGVSSIKITRAFGLQTKRNIGRWIKNKVLKSDGNVVDWEEESYDINK